LLNTSEQFFGTKSSTIQHTRYNHKHKIQSQSSPIQQQISVSDRQTKIKLAVDFFTVDDIESIWNASLHVADFEVEPLVMMIDVDVRA